MSPRQPSVIMDVRPKTAKKRAAPAKNNKSKPHTDVGAIVVETAADIVTGLNALHDLAEAASALTLAGVDAAVMVQQIDHALEQIFTAAGRVEDTLALVK